MLDVVDLSVRFGDRTASYVQAVERVSFSIAEGESFAIIGESGSGKSLTAMSLAGLQPAGASVSGSVRFTGRELVGLPEHQARRVRGREIGFVYQNPLSALNPVWRIGEQISEAVRAHEKVPRPVAAARVRELLEAVRLPDPQRVAEAYPHQLSGGMLQRAVIAMALAGGPSLLVADEPTTALDVTVKAQILDLLLDLQARLGLAILLISHDMGVVAEIADTVLVLYSGRVVEMGPAEAVLFSPRHPYTAALMRTANLSQARPKTILPAIDGSAPDPRARPPGCAFHPRCGSASPFCQDQVPVLILADARRQACHHPLA